MSADGHLWPTPEQRLLLRAALLEGEAAIDAYREWRQRVDVDADFNWQSQRLMPLVYHNLSRQEGGDPLMPRLKGVYRRAWYETHQLFQRTAPAVAALAAAGIDVLLLKGAPLVLTYYGNHALRPMSDIDVCVPHAEAARAVTVLQGLGWRPTSAPVADRYRFFHALQFVHPDGGELDLHWHVMYESLAPGFDDAFWQDTEPLNFLGTPVRQLGPTLALLHQVVHGVRWNPETPVRWIPDSLQILRRRGHDVDWERLLAIAGRMRLTTRLALGLDFLRREMDASIEVARLEQLQRVTTTAVERWENSVILTDTLAIQRQARGNARVILADFARVVDPTQAPLRFAMTLPHYLRFRFGLEGRRELPRMFLRGVARRLRGERVGQAHVTR